MAEKPGPLDAVKTVEGLEGPQCPYCGHSHDGTDLEIEGDFEGQMQCDGCSGTFWYMADYSVTWVSRSHPFE